MDNNSMRKKVNVIRHVAFEDLGSLENVFHARGYSINYYDAGYDDLTVLSKEEGTDLLVILGGPIGVYDVEHYPFLEEELKIIDAHIKHSLPILGICLGAQLIARVLGSEVYSGNNGKEIGWSGLQLTKESESDYFKYLSDKNTSVLHWHGDTFDLPKGAVLKASTTQYANQAFTFGKNILALQFHPEVTKKGLEKWFIGHANEIFSNKLSVQKLRADSEQYDSSLQMNAQKFFNGWLDAIEN